jgi:hypothetical protein
VLGGRRPRKAKGDAIVDRHPFVELGARWFDEFELGCRVEQLRGRVEHQQFGRRGEQQFGRRFEQLGILLRVQQ